MQYSLVGHTGFVGGNLAAAHGFDYLYNTKNIADAFGAANGFVVYSGMPAEKFLANADPAADLKVAENAMENIRRMQPEKLVLISTVDVYPTPQAVYEDTPPQSGPDAPAYGKNRLALEGWVRQAYPDALIIRLPGLFGKGLKKNFIFDLFTVIPSALTAAKFEELAAKQPLVAESYAPGDGGFYRLKPLPDEKKAALYAFYKGNDFNALSFTDSRSVYQFYDLSRLWADITRLMDAGLTLVNLGTEPIGAGELYEGLFGEPFVNELAKPPVRYDMRTRHAAVLGGAGDYVMDKAEVLDRIAAFAKENFGWKK